MTGRVTDVKGGEGEMRAVSACMITFNNSRTVEKALKSVASWASEIIVVDSFSTDGTFEIAKKYATISEQRPWPGFRDQYNYCISKAKNDWVIFLDADEEISKELAEEIAERLELDAGAYDGYIAHRRNYYLGRWIMHGGWVPDSEIRHFRKSKGTFAGGLHANVRLGRVGELKHALPLQRYRRPIDTINRYSLNAAQDMLRERDFLSSTCCCVRRVYKGILSKGFSTDCRAVSQSPPYYVFAKYAKLWELEQERKGLL